MIPALIAAGCGVSVALTAGWARAGRVLHRTPPLPDDLTALVQPESWSTQAVREEFAAMLPGLVTKDVFALDAQLNRRARGWTA